MIGFASNPSWQVIFVPADVTMKIRIIMTAIRADRLGFTYNTIPDVAGGRCFTANLS